MSRLGDKLKKIDADPKCSARAVGLRYFSNQNRGFYRFKNNEVYTYKDEKGTVITDKIELERFKKLVIPPAWEQVWISPYSHGHLQATGFDAKGRKQYRYHAEWNKIRNQSKFYRLRKFAESLPAIRNQINKDLKRKGLPFEKVVALVIRLLEVTNIRIGNEAYKKLYGSFGLTTLRDRHAKFNKGRFYFEFVGKKGIKHSINLQDKKLIQLVRRCRDIPGQELFQYIDDSGKHCSIDSSDVNEYIKNITQCDFTAKDFRAWAGSLNALCGFLSEEKPISSKECSKKIVSVLDSVSRKLGNTRTVCKKYYVHPTIIASFEKGTIWKYKPKNSKLNYKLQPEEKALLKLLNNEEIAAVLG